MRLKGKNAIVTGGGRGIGRADVGELAVFLAGDGAGFLTGETIVLDGGRTRRLPSPF